MTVSAVDALVMLYHALPGDDQAEVFQRINALRIQSDAGAESSTARMIRSLQRVAQHVGHAPSVDEYKQSSADLRAAGEDVETFSRLYKHFTSWRRAKEALESSETTTARRIDARFRYRKVGKVWRFTEESLRATLMRCVEHYQRPPTVAEFEWWRERELELARAQGDDALMLPSQSPYRRRYGNWEGALLHFGFTLEEATLRFDHRAEFTNEDADRYLPDGLPVAALGAGTEAALPLNAEQVFRVREAYERLPRRSRYVLTVRLGLGCEAQTLRVAAAPLALHLSRVSQLQVLALNSLCQAAAGEGRARRNPADLRDAVEATLRPLAASV